MREHQPGIYQSRKSNSEDELRWWLIMCDSRSQQYRLESDKQGYKRRRHRQNTGRRADRAPVDSSQRTVLYLSCRTSESSSIELLGRTSFQAYIWLYVLISSFTRRCRYRKTPSQGDHILPHQPECVKARRRPDQDAVCTGEDDVDD